MSLYRAILRLIAPSGPRFDCQNGRSALPSVDRKRSLPDAPEKTPSTGSAKIMPVLEESFDLYPKRVTSRTQPRCFHPPETLLTPTRRPGKKRLQRPTHHQAGTTPSRQHFPRGRIARPLTQVRRRSLPPAKILSYHCIIPVPSPRELAPHDGEECSAVGFGGFLTPHRLETERRRLPVWIGLGERFSFRRRKEEDKIFRNTLTE